MFAPTTKALLTFDFERGSSPTPLRQRFRDPPYWRVPHPGAHALE
jgi:hypothetical protein